MTLSTRIKKDLSLPFFVLLFWFLVLVSTPWLIRENLSSAALIFGSFISYFIQSWWLMEDARKQRFLLPMAYGFLNLKFFPLFFFYYLFETRGRWAFLSLFVFFLPMIILIVLVVLADLLFFSPTDLL